ncbi:MAG: hypothetical protein MI702_07030 [Chlorobiales bacterium]|nr:hypothetical protein [Chlorobiales bacterium]
MDARRCGDPNQAAIRAAAASPITWGSPPGMQAMTPGKWVSNPSQTDGVRGRWPLSPKAAANCSASAASLGASTSAEACQVWPFCTTA